MSSDPPLDDTGSGPRAPAAPISADNSEALLAELDALLERMMALPVNPLDEELAPPKPSPEPPADMPVITVTEALPEAVSPPTVTATSDDLYVNALLHEKQEEPLPPPTRPPEPPAIWNHSPSREAELESPAPAASPILPLPPSAPVSDPAAWMRPLLWCNRAFDRCTDPLGPAGHWLQHPRGRSLLGWAGLLMLAAVGGLALYDSLGWTW